MLAYERTESKRLSYGCTTAINSAQSTPVVSARASLLSRLKVRACGELSAQPSDVEQTKSCFRDGGVTAGPNGSRGPLDLLLELARRQARRHRGDISRSSGGISSLRRRMTDQAGSPGSGRLVGHAAWLVCSIAPAVTESTEEARRPRRRSTISRAARSPRAYPGGERLACPANQAGPGLFGRGFPR